MQSRAGAAAPKQHEEKPAAVELGGEPAEGGPEGAEPGSPAPDITLAALYRSDRPAVELLPGVQLSPIITACWIPGDVKVDVDDVLINGVGSQGWGWAGKIERI